jgi:hypothetical protein
MFRFGEMAWIEEAEGGEIEARVKALEPERKVK